MTLRFCFRLSTNNNFHNFVKMMLHYEITFVAESINFNGMGDVLSVNVLTRAERSIEGVSFVRRCRGQDAH